MRILFAVLVLFLEFFCGGWEWVLVSLPPLIFLNRRDQPIAGAAAVGFAWLALCLWTGDRRLFFPFSMHWAAQMATLAGRRVRAGGGMILLFLAIRVAQDATAKVLLVEAIVSVAVVSLALLAHGHGPGTWRTRAGAAIVGSLLAYGGLVF